MGLCSVSVEVKPFKLSTIGILLILLQTTTTTTTERFLTEMHTRERLRVSISKCLFCLLNFGAFLFNYNISPTLWCIKTIPLILQVHVFFLSLSTIVCIYLYSFIILNITCWIPIMLSVCMFPGLTVWNGQPTDVIYSGKCHHSSYSVLLL